MPLLMIDLPVDDFMELRKLAKEANIPLPALVNKMLGDIATRSRTGNLQAHSTPLPRLFLPK